MLQAPRYLNPALGIESKNENIFSKIEVFVLTTKKTRHHIKSWNQNQKNQAEVKPYPFKGHK